MSPDQPGRPGRTHRQPPRGVARPGEAGSGPEAGRGPDPDRGAAPGPAREPAGGPGQVPESDPADAPGWEPRGSDGAPVHGADLAREILAQAKRDARERGRGRRRAGSAGPQGDAPGHGRDDGATPDEVGARRDRMHRRRSADGVEPADDQVPSRTRLPGIAAPGREWREPVGFGPAINRLIAARGWRAQASDANVLARWDVLVGPDIADHCTPVSLRDGDLELVAESTAWATQLRMLSRQILGILHRELGPNVVRRIVVRGPTAPSWRHGPIRTGGRGPRDTYG